MGCIMSSKMESTTKDRPKVVQSATDNYGDICSGTTPKRKAERARLTPNDTWALDKLDQAALKHPNAQPPRYDSLYWDQRVLAAVSEFKRILPEFDIDLGSLQRTKVTFIIDDNHRYNDKQVFAITILMGVLIPLLNSLNASAYFVFMTHQNPERGNYDDNEQEAAKFLDYLYTMDSPARIRRAVDASNSTVIQSQKIGGGKKGTLREEIQKIRDDSNIRADDRLSQILSLIRDFRYDFTEPYKASEYDVQSFKELFTKARASSEQQPNILSNLAFYIIRTVQNQRAAWSVMQNDTSGETTRKKTVLITAEGIDKTPYEFISKQLNQVKGGGSENSIQHIEFVKHKQKRQSRGKSLDDMNEGDADIYDYTPIEMDQFLDSFISGSGLVKLLFSEERRVDSLKFNQKRPFYGQHSCLKTQTGTVELPTKEHYQVVLSGQDGQESGSSGYNVIPSRVVV